MSLQGRISDLITAVGTDIKQLKVWLTGSSSGDLTGLTTSSKTSIVSAINEVNGKTANAGAQINDNSSSTTTVYSSSKTDSQISTMSTSDRNRANHTGTQTADTITDGTTNKAYTATEKTKLSGIATGATANSSDATLENRANHTGTQTASTISDFSSAADARITAQKGQASGLASLDSSGLVPAAQLPSYVDDVLEFNNLSAFPSTGETGKIYTAKDTNKVYRWTGTAYIEISPSPGSTDAVPEGSTNLYFTNARASAAAPVQTVAGRSGAVTLAKADVGLGNVDNTSDANKPVSTAQAAADAAALQKTNNLSDLTNVGTAQSNLGVYSQSALGNPETDLVSLYTTAKS